MSYFFQPGVPVVTSPPSFKLLSNLSDYPPLFTLTCTSISFPPTFVNWTRDGEDVSEDEDFQSSQVDCTKCMYGSGQLGPVQYSL